MTELEDAKKLALESGNNFQCEVVRYLKEKEWHTLVSPFYLDISSEKPREIDIVAEKPWTLRSGGRYETINIKLYVECKYIAGTNVFWFGEKDIKSVDSWITTNTPIPARDRHINDHHYMSRDSTAKLFASSKSQSGNQEHEPIFKALNQCLNAMVSMRGRGSIIPEHSRRDMDISRTVNMPVILCNNFKRFHRVDIEKNENPVPIENNFTLEVNYAYPHRDKTQIPEFFLIDVVNFERIDEYFAAIQKDVDIFKRILDD